MRSRIVLFAVLSGLAIAAPSRAAASEYPSRTIRFVGANLAGGTSDILACLAGAKLADVWKPQFIVGNRPGASGLIGNELVGKSPPDGTLEAVCHPGGA